jgi:hypothetical protein
MFVTEPKRMKRNISKKRGLERTLYEQKELLSDVLKTAATPMIMIRVNSVKIVTCLEYAGA